MISLAAPTYDPAGSILLRCRPSNPYSAERRGTVTATLDGGVSVYDAGYSVADTTLTTSLANPTRAQLVTLQYLVAYYADLVLCCEIGAFSARVSVALNGSTLAISMRLLRRLDA